MEGVAAQMSYMARVPSGIRPCPRTSSACGAPSAAYYLEHRRMPPLKKKTHRTARRVRASRPHGSPRFARVSGPHAPCRPACREKKKRPSRGDGAGWRSGVEPDARACSRRTGARRASGFIALACRPLPTSPLELCSKRSRTAVDGTPPAGPPAKRLPCRLSRRGAPSWRRMPRRSIPTPHRT